MPLMRVCPVCGQQNTRLLFRPSASPGPVSKCLNCGMVYVDAIEDPRALIFNGPVSPSQADPKVLTSANLNDVKDSWELKALPDKEFEWPALRQNAIEAIQRIERYIQKQPFQRRILDFGSGWGFFLAVAKEYGWNAYGLEPLTAQAVYARAKFGLNITTDTLHEHTFPADFFDVITSFQVFEHLPHPRVDIHNLYRMLQQDGLILIEVPDFDTWTMRIMKSHHRHFVQDHLNFFSGKTLGQLLAMSGFKVVEQFHPKRNMSFHHLFKYWVRRYLPVSLSNTLQNLLNKSGLIERTIGLNVGDILTVLARKQ